MCVPQKKIWASCVGSREFLPSFSNPADSLSREITERCRGVPRIRVDLVEIWKKCQNEKKSPSLQPGGGREA